MKMYLPSGYLNMEEIMEDKKYPFVFGVGARGIGKTYGALEYLMKKTEKKFILLRLTQAEAELVASEEANPFKPLGPEISDHIKFKKVDKNTTAFFFDGELKGVVMALSTFAKVRGADFSDYDFIFFDEYIPEKHIKKIAHTGEALKNCYETVNRNRELNGQDPVKLVCMANALNFNNDILIEFHLSEPLHRMQKKNQQFFFDDSRGLMLIYPQNSPISEKKNETALYKLGGRYNEMALDNTFREYYDGNIRSMNLKGYKAMYIFDTLCFYRSVNSDRTWYISETCKGSFKEEYGNTEFEQMQFIRKHMLLHDLYLGKKIIFESPELELRFVDLFKIT